jgi:hypothetical protein
MMKLCMLSAVRRRSQSQDDLISAAEIACFAYFPEQWRLEYGLGLKPANRAARDAGTRHHARKATAERMEGGSITLGRFLLLLAVIGLLTALVLFRVMETRWIALAAVLAGLLLVLMGRCIWRRRGLGAGRTISLDKDHWATWGDSCDNAHSHRNDSCRVRLSNPQRFIYVTPALAMA